MQTAIDEERTNSGITMLAHPRYSEAYSIDWNEATGWKRYSLVEIANGLGPEEFLDDIPSNPTDLADDFYQIWWTGVDDAHNNTTNVDKWCVVVQTASSSISQADLLSSLDSGNFYTREGPCSTGVNLTGVSLSDDTLTVTLDNIESTYTVKWYKRGRQLAETDSNVDTTANFTLTGTEGYVFAEITRDNDNKRAYTQPFFIGNKTDLSNSVSCGGGSSCNNIIDNNPSTYWDAGAGTGNFTIDVGSSKLINAIKIQWSSSGSPSDRWNYKIETSPDNSTWTEQMRTSFSNRQSTTIDFFDIDARYVKVTVTGQSVGGGSDIRVLEAETFDSSPERTNYYINNVSGSDSNNGLTPETAWQNWNNALPRVRPRDTLNLINSGTAYAGGMDINIPFVFGEVGKHQYARFVFQGESSENRTPVNATGSDYGIRQTRSYVDIRNFEIYNAVAQGAGISFTAGTGSTIDNCILRNNQRRGFVLNGGQNATIQNSYIYGNGEGGIQNYNNSGILNVINCQIYSNNGIGIGSEFSTSINIRRTVLSSYKLNNNNWLQSSSISS